jgi:hypothetical protein
MKISLGWERFVLSQVSEARPGAPMFVPEDSGQDDSSVSGLSGENRPSAAKAAADFAGLMYGLKPVPFTLEFVFFISALFTPDGVRDDNGKRLPAFT